MKETKKSTGFNDPVGYDKKSIFLNLFFRSIIEDYYSGTEKRSFIPFNNFSEELPSEFFPIRRIWELHEE